MNAVGTNSGSGSSPPPVVLGSRVEAPVAAGVAAAAPRRQLTAWRLPVSVRLQEDGVRLQPHPLYRRSSESQIHRRLSTSGCRQDRKPPISRSSEFSCLCFVWKVFILAARLQKVISPRSSAEAWSDPGSVFSGGSYQTVIVAFHKAASRREPASRRAPLAFISVVFVLQSAVHTFAKKNPRFTSYRSGDYAVDYLIGSPVV